MPVTLSDGLMPLSYPSSPFLFTPGRRVLCKSAEHESTSSAAATVPEEAPSCQATTPSPKRTVAGHPALRRGAHRTRPASVSSSISSTPSSGYSSGATSPLSSSLPSSPCGSARGSVTSSSSLEAGGDASWWREQELRAERSSLAHKVIRGGGTVAGIR